MRTDAKNITLLFWPEENKPSPLSRVRRICEEYSVKFHSDPLQHYDLHFFWSYTPRYTTPDSFTLTAPNVINRGCWNVSKEKVNDIFNDIHIDPTTYDGICVEKLDMQGRHGNHRLVQCPMLSREDYVYQRYIKDKEEGYFIKYRIFYADGIDFILKYRQKDVFGMEYVDSSFVDKLQFFPPAIEKEFNEKCLRFGVDFAEIDFVSDNGTPIIVDVNNVAGMRLQHSPDIMERIDNGFLNFIQRRYDQSG